MAFLEIEDLQKVFYTPEGNVGTIIYVPEIKLEQGDALVLDGPSGSGKTTILHLVSGLLAPDSGSITFAGEELTQLEPAARACWRAQNVGYVLQKLNLLPELTVMENILLPLCWEKQETDEEALRVRAQELLRRVGLQGKERLTPLRLSIGEQQRVAVVRALLRKPALVLADEPTASLDKHNGELVLALLQRLCRENQAILLLSTHDEAIKSHFAKRYDVRRGCYE
ncbi:MAG: ATP-binding cassette domain-containing protein [Phascolarctobacterium sp.]|nr:ATP-binding cassette domain-containing protein [Phascolarctobacterium sp.]